MTKHATTLPYVDLEKLAKDMSDLRYDSLGSFIATLAEKIRQDGIADGKRGRSQLGLSLLNASNELFEASQHIQQSWLISKPYMTAEIMIMDTSVPDEKVREEIEKIDFQKTIPEDRDALLALLEKQRPELFKKW